MTQPTINQRLKILIDALGVSIRSFSSTLGVSDTNTRNYINRGSVPGADFIEKVLRHFERVNPSWLMLGEGEMFLNVTAEPRAVYQTKNQGSGITVGHNAGSVAQHFASTAECEQEVARLRRENELLLSQLQDKELIIQLLRGQQK